MTFEHDRPEITIADVDDIFTSKRQAGRAKDNKALPAFPVFQRPNDQRQHLREKYNADLQSRDTPPESVK